MMEHLLDNPAWHALNSGNQPLALGTQTAKYFRGDVSPFAGIAHFTAACFNALYNAVPDEDPVALFTDRKNLHPAPWRAKSRIDGYQMLFNEKVPAGSNQVDIVPLTTHTVPQMLALSGLTQPGPFLPGTIDFGHYEGIYRDDQLVAMAGWRFQTGPYIEISAVCTHPDHVGNGYARQLLVSQIRHIQSVGHTAYLHVRADNNRAISVYEKMGFVTRKDMFIHVLTKS